MPSYNKECFFKEENGFFKAVDNVLFPHSYTEVSNAGATVMTKTFLWNLTFEQKYVSRKSEW